MLCTRHSRIIRQHLPAGQGVSRAEPLIAASGPVHFGAFATDLHMTALLMCITCDFGFPLQSRTRDRMHRKKAVAGSFRLPAWAIGLRRHCSSRLLSVTRNGALASEAERVLLPLKLPHFTGIVKP